MRDREFIEIQKNHPTSRADGHLSEFAYSARLSLVIVGLFPWALSLKFEDFSHI